MKYFRYERDHARRWKPALYDQKPPASGVNGSGPEASEWVTITPLQDGYPSLELIMKRVEAPQE